MPSSHWRGVRSTRASKCATCCSAWTPASVRPDPCTVTVSSATKLTAAASVSWTLRPDSWLCQPMKSVPSYSSPSAILGMAWPLRRRD